MADQKWPKCQLSSSAAKHAEPWSARSTPCSPGCSDCSAAQPSVGLPTAAQRPDQQEQVRAEAGTVGPGDQQLADKLDEATAPAAATDPNGQAEPSTWNGSSSEPFEQIQRSVNHLPQHTALQVPAVTPIYYRLMNTH